VLSIVITLGGAIAGFSLPIAQFPQVSPPTVNVTCTYPGASAKDVAEAVASHHRKTGQRCRGHDVHVVELHERWPVQLDRHIPSPPLT